VSLTSLGAGLIPTPVPSVVQLLKPAAPLNVPAVTSNEALKRYGWSMPELFESPKTITVYKPRTLGPTTLLLEEAFRQARRALLERDRVVAYSAVLRDLLLGEQGSRGAR
jgi:hypothetical protein